MSFSRHLLAGLTAAFLTAAPLHAAGKPRFTPPALWAIDFGAAPRIPMVGDADADSHADLLALWPRGAAIVDMALNNRGAKSFFPAQARTGWGRDPIAAVAGRFADEKGAQVLALFPGGELRLARAFSGTKYAEDEVVGRVRDLPLSLDGREGRGVRAPGSLGVAGDFDGDGRTDAVFVAPDGGATLLLNTGRAGGERFRAVNAGRLRPEPRWLQAGTLAGSDHPDLVWLTAKGEVWRAAVSPVGIGKPSLVTRATPDSALAVGRFSGERAVDILVGGKLLVGGDPKAVVDVPAAAEPAGASLAWAADMDGDGRDDLVRYRRAADRFSGSDVLVHFATDEGDPDSDRDGLTDTEERAAGSNPLRRDSAGDGLLDGWKVKGVAGLDLKALGCSPRQRDIVVEVQRVSNVPEERVRREMERVVAFYAGLPVANPDGSTGIRLHVIHREPIPEAEARGKGWGELGDRHLPKSHRGITHWMLVTQGSGGQSAELADMGSCGVNALYATFIHEFGHQLGLDHTGRWGPAWCPVYPSLMNYAYSYQLGGNRDAIGYSRGDLAGLVLNETKLSEVLPVPIEKVRYLSGPPYHYRLRAEGQTTHIDWDWNGIAGEKQVRADINYGYSTYGGERHNLDVTQAAPFLVAHGGQLVLFYVQETRPAEKPAEPPVLQSGRLLARQYLGEERWSEPVEVIRGGVTGDPFVLSDGRTLTVFTPTAAGVEMRSGTASRTGPPSLGEPTLLPESAGCQVSAAAFAGRQWAFLWKDEDAPVRVVEIARGQPGAPKEMGFSSTFPVGAAVTLNGHELWLGTGEDQSDRRLGRWQVRRYLLRDGGLAEVGMDWVSGEEGGDRGSTRPTLVFEPDKAFAPNGRLHFIAGGFIEPGRASQCYFDAMQVADKRVRGGWITKRYYDEWTQSRSAAAATWFGNDIILASRWIGTTSAFKDDQLYVAHNGLGISPVPMGDFDDIGYIAAHGIQRSILYQSR
jgi:hypothetical protein